MPFSLALKDKEVGCQPGRYLLEGQIFDLDRELAQAVGQNSQHVERQGRAFVDQIDKGFAGKKSSLLAAMALALAGKDSPANTATWPMGSPGPRMGRNFSLPAGLFCGKMNAI